MIFLREEKYFEGRQAGWQSLCTLHRQQARGGPCPSFFFNELSFCSYCFSPRKENKKSQKTPKSPNWKSFLSIWPWTWEFYESSKLGGEAQLSLGQKIFCSRDGSPSHSSSPPPPASFSSSKDLLELLEEVGWPHFVAISIIRVVVFTIPKISTKFSRMSHAASVLLS